MTRKRFKRVAGHLSSCVRSPRRRSPRRHLLAFRDWYQPPQRGYGGASGRTRPVPRGRGSARGDERGFVRAGDHLDSRAPGSGCLPPSGGRAARPGVRDERAKQHRRHPGLGDAMGDRQPRVTKSRPPDRLIAAELASRVEEPVDVEGDAPALQSPGQRAGHGRLPRTRSAGDHEQWLDRSGIQVPALRADSESVPRLHEDRAVA